MFSFTAETFHCVFLLAAFAQADFELDKAGAVPSLCSNTELLPRQQVWGVGAGGATVPLLFQPWGSANPTSGSAMPLPLDRAFSLVSALNEQLN